MAMTAVGTSLGTLAFLEAQREDSLMRREGARQARDVATYKTLMLVGRTCAANPGGKSFVGFQVLHHSFRDSTSEPNLSRSIHLFPILRRISARREGEPWLTGKATHPPEQQLGVTEICASDSQRRGTRSK